MGKDYDLRYFAELKSKKIDWLWYPYIPFGKITIIEGDPGEGKTTVVLNFISSLSTGKSLPFSNSSVQIKSIYQNAEDDNEDTIKPRLEKQGADCENVCFISKNDGFIYIDDDSIEKAIIESGAKVIVLDPIQAYIGDNIDMNRANIVRPKMTKLKEVAERTGCAIILVGHLNKSSGSKASYRSLGSIDFFAAARSILLVAKINGSDNIKALAQLKNNLAPIGKTLSFRITNGVVEWLSECDITADELLSGSANVESKEYAAEVLLNEILENGKQPVNVILDIASSQGIGKRTLKSAKSMLPIHSVKVNNCWYWELEKQSGE